ncbi:TonB-dependent receptor domain-containing protein [Flavobacterium sp.]|uniref:TonB-dependent receptor domain-containing protein n=1 Tax=Flavobacterium sp. TaxID=239 RepID=UPI0039E35DBC
MLKVIHFVTSFLLILFATMASAQTDKISISGQLQSADGNVSDAVVYLLSGTSQSLVKTEYTDANGNFTFQHIAKGSYSIRMTQNNKTIYSGTAFEASTDVNLGLLSADVNAKQLEEVTIVKARPYIERQDGKTILNVENSIAAVGSSAFEVLERAPGVNVDANDNISLRGRSGIIVQIDGKPTPMSGTNLANYLRGIPSGSVEKIEFITNPSSKYDAAGTSIINIKMKKDKRKGTNGSVSVAAGHGKYVKSNNNLSLNHRNKNVNLFGNYSFAYREGFSKLLLDRKFYEGDAFNSAFEQNNNLKMNFRNHIARLGMDYFVNDKHTIGVLVSGVNNRFDPTGRNNSEVYDATGARVSNFQTENHSHDKWHNYSANLNYKFVIDTVGTEFTTDLDFASYGNKTEQNFDTTYRNYDGSAAPNPYRLFGDLNGDLNIYAIKSDFVKTINKIKFETGIKSSYVKADNNLKYYNRSSGTDVFDPSKSNHFIYKENINAAYVNASKAFGKWNVQLGLRIENTNIEGEQLAYNSTFDDSYTQLFPSALVSYAVNDKNSVEFNYSRRIQRPSYDQLNPFRFYLDPTTYKEGNPFLTAQTTHSIELTHVLNQKIYTTLSYSRTEDNITETISPSQTEAQVTIQTNRNLTSVDIYGLYLIVPTAVTKWWDSTNNFNFYVATYNGNVANTPLSNAGNFTWNVSSTNNFKLGNGFFAELGGEYRANERYAFDKIEPIWFMNSGLQKKFKNKSSLKIAMTDMFGTNRIKAKVNFTGYEEHFRVSRDTRVVTLSYTYNFGNGNGAARRRTGGADDIKQRAGQSNG